MNNEVSVNGGTMFSGALTILFIALKLCKVIAWSWWWVLGPLWIPFVIVVAIFAVVFIGAVIAGLIVR